MKTILSFVTILLAIATHSFSQNNFWSAADKSQLLLLKTDQELFKGSFQPTAYKLFNLNETALSATLKQSPRQADVAVAKSNFIISVPMADGTIQKFRITESPVMMPELQAKYPEIRTYLGRGVDDASLNIRFDYSPQGFHAVIISPKRNTVYINPVPSMKGLYAAFDRNNISQEDEVFNCKAGKFLQSGVQGIQKIFTTSDGNLRTYRFAVATGGEFSALLLSGSETTVAQKKASVMAALVTDLIRTNIIYETDLGIHLDYVDNEDTLIFLDGATDPFLSNSNGYNSGKWQEESQHAIDSLIGTANYDIGHLLMGYNTGGLAHIGDVCNTTTKASAVTGFKKYLTDDPFVVDFWDHEIGHQFGAYHTYDYMFDGTTNGTEPGSGSTIMGYAGVTGATDIQQHSDPYFHAASISEIETYITYGDGAGCPVVSATDNAVPDIHAGKDYTIPKSTPFVLTAKATDDDVTNLLTYCWEQYNEYKDDGTSNKFPNANSTTGPVFRSLTPSTLPDRTFPALNSILDGTNGNKWEVLPGVARSLNFRVTVRDNVPGGGNTNSDDMVVTVDGNSGPFKITVPNASTTFGSGSLQIVKWNVANTNAAPVKCTLVNILLSVDGGITFPTVLAANTPNDGIQAVPIPLFTNTITHARIKIEAAANIFFDISDADFAIEGSLPLRWVSFNAQKVNDGSALLKWSVANKVNNNHFEIERSSDALHFTELSSISAGKNSPLVQTYSYTDIQLPSGTIYYRIKQVDNDGKYSYTNIAKIDFDAHAISWRVAPNPASDHATILFNANATNVNVYLNDGSGKVIYRNILPSINTGSQLTIPFSNLSKGVYVLRVETGNEIRTEKIIKN